MQLLDFSYLEYKLRNNTNIVVIHNNPWYHPYRMAEPYVYSPQVPPYHPWYRCFFEFSLSWGWQAAASSVVVYQPWKPWSSIESMHSGGPSWVYLIAIFGIFHDNSTMSDHHFDDKKRTLNINILGHWIYVILTIGEHSWHESFSPVQNNRWLVAIGQDGWPL